MVKDRKEPQQRRLLTIIQQPKQVVNGSTSIRIDSSNGFNSNGSKVRGYDSCKNHLDKKKS